MKLKLTSSEFKALFEILEVYVTNQVAKTMNQKLLYAHAFAVLQKLYKKGAIIQKKYKLNLYIPVMVPPYSGHGNPSVERPGSERAFSDFKDTV